MAKQKAILPEKGSDKIRLAHLKKVSTKIRRDALSCGGKDPLKFGEKKEISLEESLHNKLARLKQININEESFTYSLKKVHDKGFITKLLPSIMNKQNKFSP